MGRGGAEAVYNFDVPCVRGDRRERAFLSAPCAAIV